MRLEEVVDECLLALLARLSQSSMASEVRRSWQLLRRPVTGSPHFYQHGKQAFRLKKVFIDN